MQYIQTDNDAVSMADGSRYIRDCSALRDLSVAMVVFPEAGTPWAEKEPFTGRIVSGEDYDTIMSIAQPIFDDALAEHTAPEPVVPPTADDVVAERSRRLAEGFDYDFGDARGVHHFATAESDMANWSEVTSLANALINLGDTTTTIDIITDTGPAQVTAQEWQQILVAAGAFRQPIFAASFVLQAMDPIPADFADDSYWPA